MTEPTARSSGGSILPTTGRQLLLMSLLLALTAFLYAFGWSGAFLFDDVPAITANPLLKIDGSGFDQWRIAALSGNAGPLGRPVAMLSFAAHHALSGTFDVVDFKIVNTLLHGVSGLLIFLLTRELLKVPAQLGVRPSEVRWLALLTAALWLLHPLHVSTVLYAVQRMAQLSTLFILAGLYLFTRYRSRWAVAGASPGDVLACLLWLFLFTLLAAFSKENGVLLPWLVVVCEMFVYRGQWAGAVRLPLQRAAWVAGLAPALIILGLIILQPQWLDASYAGRTFDLNQRLLSEARILWSYLGLLFWPQPHAMSFQHDYYAVSVGLLSPLSTLVAVLAWMGAVVAAALLWRRVPVLAFALGFFLVAHSLESTIIPLELFYEHRNYLPAYAACILGAYGLVRLGRLVSRALVVGVSGVVLALLALGLAARVDTWSDDVRLAQSNAVRHPESARSQYFLANSLLRQYRARERLALSDEQASTAVALARHHFEVMHQNDPGEISALVMLHYVDGRFYRGSGLRGGWLQSIMETLDGRPLSASSANALVLLAECLGDASCEGGRAAQNTLEARLETHYSNPAQVAFLRLRFLASADAPLVERRAALDTYLAVPGVDGLPLLESAQNHLAMGDRTAFYDDLQRWFAGDSQARYLATQQALLNAAR